MHVLLIHQAFAGPNDPGGTRHYELASGLVERGHRVTIIASAVTYMTGEERTVAETALPEGLRVIRVAATRGHHRSYLARGTALFAFAGAALRAALRVRDVDVVWATSPPLVQVLPAWLVALRARAVFVFEERDLWPEFAIGMGVVRNRVLARLAFRFKRLMYARAVRVVINSPGFLPYLTGYGVPTEKIHVIPNGVDVTQFDPLARGEELRRAWQADGRFVVVYAGALGPANGLEVILDAADRLRETPALFVLVGDGKARSDLVAAAERRRLENVRFLPAQPKSLMPAVIAAADACVATLRDIPLFRTTYPNKVFDYMAAGRPVVLGIDGVIREVVEGSGAGVFVEPGNAVALAATVRRLMEAPDEARAMGARGRRAACATFDRRLQAAQLESVLAGLDRALRLDLRRILDLLLAVGLLPIALPVMLLVAVLVRVAMGSSVLFRHPRTGLRGRGFTLYKFRTMRVGDPELPDDARLTPLGRWLRSLSLDELPQLWNVLRGDMAIVGPRPLLPQYLQRYTPEQGRRHNVRPGITGLAQVSGRNALTWPEKFALDVWYVDHRSLRLDLWILWRTVVTVVHGRGIGAPGRATMPEFMGEAS